MLRGYSTIPGVFDTGLAAASFRASERCFCTYRYLALVFFIATPLLSQTTGELSGVISDEVGEPLGGSLVATESPALIAEKLTNISDRNGRFTFPALPIGTYRVTVELEGYATQQVEEVQVTVKKTTNLHVSLSPSTVLDQINVTSRTPVVDPEQTSQSQVFDLEYLQNATIGLQMRDYLDVVKQSPGVVDSVLCADTIDPNVFGSMDNENLYILDGSNMTLPENMTWGKIVNFDAIQEISLETAGYRAEYGTTTGGIINVVTKSGGDQFHGTLDLRQQSSAWAENGEHFDRDEEPTRYQVAAATLGGPILTGRLWFFAAASIQDSRWTPQKSRTTMEFDGQNFLGKLTWQASPAWTLVGQLATDPVTIHNQDASPWVEPEATSAWNQGGPLTRLGVQGVLSEKLLWNLRGSTFRGDISIVPESGDYETIGHYEFTPSGISSVNATENWRIDRSRNELHTDVSFLAGYDHSLKAGLGYTAETHTEEFQLVTGYRYDDAFGEPYALLYAPPAGDYTFDGDHLGLFAQDNWRILPSLNLYMGLRWDSTTQFDNAGNEVAALSRLQPRLGLAWQITRDGKTVARASWGQFMHPNTLQLAQLGRAWKNAPEFYYFSCSASGYDQELCQRAFSGEVTVEDHTVETWIPDPGGSWDPNGYFLWDWYLRTGSEMAIAAGLRPMFSEQLVLAIEREFAHRSSIELSYVDKAGRDLFEDTCSGNLPEPSEDADCETFTLANLPFLERTYEGWIVSVRSRAKPWLNLLGSYTYSKSLGNIESRGADYDYDFYPELWENRYGYLSDDRRHRLRLNGYFLLPWHTTAAFEAAWMSEYPYTVVEPIYPWGFQFHEPRGSRRAAPIHWINLQLSKAFHLGPTNLTLIGSVMNLLDDEQVTSVCEGYWGCTIDEEHYELDEPIFYMQPRHYEMGVRVEF